MVLLEGLKVTKHFGGLAALKDVDFFVREREIVGLIGPNGAGKTTLINCICGVHDYSGTIKFLDVKLNGLRPHKIFKLGVGRTFQVPRPFGNMTTLENVMVCGDCDRKSALSFLELVGLDHKKDVRAKDLIFHERRLLEIARVLSSKPKIMLLDEIAAGLNPVEIENLRKLIKKIRNDYGIAVLWVEHIMKAVMPTSDRIMVLQNGEKIAEGSPKEIANDEKVIKAYLGERYVFNGEEHAERR